MRADERQAAVAYAYAWWMTGDDDVAAAALREAISQPDPAEDSDEARLVALMSGVRSQLGDARAMPAASEVALLHDGFDVPLDPAARLALVPPPRAPDQLAHGRLEALLETVREDFRHPERLGGLAVGKPEDLEHAEECRSCNRARALIERGRVELREVSPVSAPPGLIASLVAEFSPPAEAPPVDAETPADLDEVDLDTAPADLDDAPAADEIVLDTLAPVDVDVDGAPAADEIVLDTAAPVDVDLEEAAGVDAAPVEVEPAELEPVEEEEPARPRKGAIALLVTGGLITACALVALMVGSAGDDPEPAVDPPADQATADPGVRPEPTETGATEPAFGPDGGERKGFSVVDAGLLLSGAENMAPSATTIGPDEPLRIAVDYENGTKGVRLDALWRVNDEIYDRLHAVVSAKSSRHVWGLPVPPDGWPVGRHRIVVTANDSVAAAIDFTVRDSN